MYVCMYEYGFLLYCSGNITAFSALPLWAFLWDMSLWPVFPSPLPAFDLRARTSRHLGNSFHHFRKSLLFDIGFLRGACQDSCVSATMSPNGHRDEDYHSRYDGGYDWHGYDDDPGYREVQPSDNHYDGHEPQAGDGYYDESCDLDSARLCRWR